MSFASVLNAYCNATGRTNREIAERCGLSPSTLSRYRNGERVPEAGGEVVEKLVGGITELYNDRSADEIWRVDVVRSALAASLAKPKILGMSFGSRFDALMDSLHLRNAEAAQELGVSPSYVSRIRNGQRVPANQRVFAEQCARFFSERCIEADQIERVIDLVDPSKDMVDVSGLRLDDHQALFYAIELWLLGDNILESDLKALKGLFEKINSLYFEDELASLNAHEPDALLPETRDQFSEFYYGVEQMKKAEMTFLKTALAHGAKEVFLSSDMPVLDLSLEADFIREYSLRIGDLIRSGAHITAIHSIERPLAETTMSIEWWLPLALMGHLSAYYLKGATSRLFFHVNNVCEACVLAAEAMREHQSDGRYYFSTMDEDITYYRKKMGFIMERAIPMLQVYRESVPEERKKYNAWRKKIDKSGSGRTVAADAYENLSIVSYSTDCAAVTILGSSPVRLVLNHPRLGYVISRF